MLMTGLVTHTSAYVALVFGCLFEFLKLSTGVFPSFVRNARRVSNAHSVRSAQFS